MQIKISQGKRHMRQTESGRLPDTKLPLSSGCVSWCRTNTHRILPTREAHPSLVSKVFIRASLHRHDRLIDCLHGSQPPGQLIQVTQSSTISHMVSLSGIASPTLFSWYQWPSPRYSVTILNKDTHPKQRHSCHVWHWFPPRNKGKVQNSLCIRPNSLLHSSQLKLHS